jgi:hypothetical protein
VAAVALHLLVEKTFTRLAKIFIEKLTSADKTISNKQKLKNVKKISKSFKASLS